MFDMSWFEIAFVAVLALIVVGPKDLPKLLKMVGQAVRKAQKAYRSILGSINQLEKEIDIVDGKAPPHAPWQAFVPDDLKRSLPEGFTAGTMSAEELQQRKEQRRLAVADAKERYDALMAAEDKNNKAD